MRLQRSWQARRIRRSTYYTGFHITGRNLGLVVVMGHGVTLGEVPLNFCLTHTGELTRRAFHRQFCVWMPVCVWVPVDQMLPEGSLLGRTVVANVALERSYVQMSAEVPQHVTLVLGAQRTHCTLVICEVVPLQSS